MTKNTKMLLAVGVIGVAGYYYWKSKQTKTTTTAPAKAGFLAGKVTPMGSNGSFQKFSGPVGDVMK
jgi:hypothetical protein